MTDEVSYNIAAIRELLAAAFDDVSEKELQCCWKDKLY